MIYKKWKEKGKLSNWYKQTLIRIAFSKKNLKTYAKIICNTNK